MFFSITIKTFTEASAAIRIFAYLFLIFLNICELAKILFELFWWTWKLIFKQYFKNDVHLEDLIHPSTLSLTTFFEIRFLRDTREGI